MIAKSGLFTSLFLLMLTILYIVAPAVPPSLQIVALFVPALLLAFFFNPFVWGVGWLLYELVGSAISAVVGWAVGGPVGAGVSLFVSGLAITIAFLTKVIPLLIGALYSLALGPLYFVILAGNFGVYPTLFVVFVLYYFVFGGKHIPYLLGAMTAEAILFGASVGGLPSGGLYLAVAGIALALLGAAALGMIKTATGIRDAFVRVSYLYMLAHLGIRGANGLVTGGFITGNEALSGYMSGLNQLLDALAKYSFGILAPAGVILILLVLGLFSGKYDIPDNLMKIIALFVLVSLAFPSGASLGQIIGIEWSSWPQVSAGYYDTMVQTSDRIVPGSADIINKVVSPARDALKSAFPAGVYGGGYGGAGHYMTVFQGENVGGNIEQPQPSGTAPSPGERWGVEIKPSGEEATKLLTEVFNKLGAWSLLLSSVFMVGFAYIMDVMAGTVGMDIFAGVSTAFKPMAPKKVELERAKKEEEALIERTAKAAVKEMKIAEASERLGKHIAGIKEGAVAASPLVMEFAKRAEEEKRLREATKKMGTVQVRPRWEVTPTGEKKLSLEIAPPKRPGPLGRAKERLITRPFYGLVQKRAAELTKKPPKVSEKKAATIYRRTAGIRGAALRTGKVLVEGFYKAKPTGGRRYWSIRRKKKGE